AAITSCTNTSNPSVMVAAGLLAKKAVEKGLAVRPEVKTSLAPGSRVVSRYLEKTGLQPYLDKLGFVTVGYGCTTCIGNSGPLEPHVEQIVTKNDVVAASVLSGNRSGASREWSEIPAGSGLVYAWNPKSTYIREPPYFEGFKDRSAPRTDIREARPLAIFGDSVTTDHISPAGSIKPTSPAGKY